jgi:hypothetical protein
MSAKRSCFPQPFWLVGDAEVQTVLRLATVRATCHRLVVVRGVPRMFWLSVAVAFISAVVIVLGLLHDDSGPDKGATGAGIAIVGIIGLFVGAFIGTL